MRARKRDGSLFLAPARYLTAVLLVVSAWTFAFGGDTQKDLPERYISLSPEYPGVILESGNDISIDVTVKNGGKRDENVKLEVTAIPEGWKAWFKTYSFGITGVHVASDKSKSLTLRVEPKDDDKVGEYRIGIKAVTEDGALFTYEAIPRAAFLWMEVVEDNYRENFPNNTQNWQSPIEVVDSGLEWAEHLGVGGMVTRGFGRLRKIHCQEVPR